MHELCFKFHRAIYKCDCETFFGLIKLHSHSPELPSATRARPHIFHMISYYDYISIYNIYTSNHARTAFQATLAIVVCNVKCYICLLLRHHTRTHASTSTTARKTLPKKLTCNNNKELWILEKIKQSSTFFAHTRRSQFSRKSESKPKNEVSSVWSVWSGSAIRWRRQHQSGGGWQLVQQQSAPQDKVAATTACVCGIKYSGAYKTRSYYEKLKSCNSATNSATDACSLS